MQYICKACGKHNHGAKAKSCRFDGVPKGGRAYSRPRDIMKRKSLVLVLLVTALLLMVSVAGAETDPIVCSVEVTPAKLAAPGPVDVTINISNSGETDMKDPVVLYDPVGQVVTDFGTNGAVTLKAGESKTWTGKWDVSQRVLNTGSVVFFVKYTLYKDSGEAYAQSQPIRGKVSGQAAEAVIDIKRTISPSTAREGQTVTVTYNIANNGTVGLKNITVQESREINKDSQKVETLAPGKTASVKFPFTMGKKSLTSKATVSYQTESSSKTQQQEIEAATINYGEAAMTAKLTPSAKGVAVNGKFTLTLELSNKGSVDYTNLRVTDSTLGEVFTNQSLKKDGSLKLEKEITLTQTTEYQFTITAIDNTGTEVSLATDPVKVEAVDPNKVLHLAVETSADRTEVYEQPGKVRFSVTVTNDSEVEAKNVDILHGTTKIYTFASILPGETRKLTRDAALSMAGKYQFTASTKDAFENTVSFPGNEVQVAFSVPTPAPETPTPAPDPTPEPTFSPVTMPPINDPSFAAFPKMVQTVLLPILIIGSLMLIGSGVLLAIATKKRADQKKASEAAYDHLERSKRRDYVSEAEAEEEVEIRAAKERVGKNDEKEAVKRKREDLPLDDVELPHMKYIRSAYDRSASKQPEEYQKGKSSLYDDELYGVDEVLTQSSRNKVMYEEPYQDDYAGGSYDSYGQERYADDYPADGSRLDQDGYDDYPEEYAMDSDGADGHYPDDRLPDAYETNDTGDGYADEYAPYEGEETPERRAGRARGGMQSSDVGY